MVQAVTSEPAGEPLRRRVPPWQARLPHSGARAAGLVPSARNPPAAGLCWRRGVIGKPSRISSASPASRVTCSSRRAGCRRGHPRRLQAPPCSGRHNGALQFTSDLLPADIIAFRSSTAPRSAVRLPAGRLRSRSRRGESCGSFPYIGTPFSSDGRAPGQCRPMGIAAGRSSSSPTQNPRRHRHARAVGAQNALPPMRAAFQPPRACFLA